MSDTSADTLVFCVNGVERRLRQPDVDPDLTLAHYLRRVLRLTGTKVACGEGACGSCTVTLSSRRGGGRVSHVAVKSCLTKVASLHGAAVTTVEGVGRASAMHPAQERIFKSHGSQCGFCTPGMVMSATSLLRDRAAVVDIEDVQECLQGNLCRCTGYRPIVEGLQTFCSSSDNKSKKPKFEPDDEYEEVLKLDEKEYREYDPEIDDPKIPEAWMKDSSADVRMLKLEGADGRDWYRPRTMEQLKQLQTTLPSDFGVFAGGTSFYRPPSAKTPVVQVGGIDKLANLEVSQDGLKIGAAVTLGELKKIHLPKVLREGQQAGRELVEAFLKALSTLGSPQVRNAATVGGSVVWGAGSPDSDLMPLYLVAGASADVLGGDGGIRAVDLSEGLALEMGSVVVALNLPWPKEGVRTGFFRRGRRKEFSYPVANCAVQAKLEGGTVTGVRICLSGAESDLRKSKRFAPRLETGLMEALEGKNIKELPLQVLNGILDKSGVRLDEAAPGEWSRYRMAQYAGFLARFFGGESGEDALRRVAPGDRTSVLTYQRPEATQPAQDPVTRPLAHLWAAEQACGSAVYVDDIVPAADEIQLVLIRSERAHAEVVGIDFGRALEVPGVVGVLRGSDLESNLWGLVVKDEAVFADKEVKYHGQIVAAIACEDLRSGRAARKLVRVEYRDLPAVLSLREAEERDSKYATVKIEREQQQEETPPKQVSNFKGRLHLGGQEHWYLEPHCALAAPSGEKDELTVHTSTQEPAVVQGMIAHVLGLPRNRVTVKCRRAGGAFGGKERSHVALIAAAAARKFGRSARLVLTRREDVAVTGHRHEVEAEYDVDFDLETGRLVRVGLRCLVNAGASTDLSLVWCNLFLIRTDGGYTIRNYNGEAVACDTNTPSNTAMRGFGGPEGAIVAEEILERVAHLTGLDPAAVREANLTSEGDRLHFGEDTLTGVTLGQCWTECKRRSGYEVKRREVEEFNSRPGWVKRGVALVPMKFAVTMGVKVAHQSSAYVRVMLDGSVLLSHGGIEMGQGLNTKMVQVASRALGVPHDIIHIVETSTDTVANATPTGGSCGTDLCGPSVIKACEVISGRLEKYRKVSAGWDEAVAAAHADRVNLSDVGFYDWSGVTFNPEKLDSGSFADYWTYGAACVEVEVDCADGDVTVTSADLVVDVGKSLNPAVDLGQVEGAFLQALGYVTTEQLLTDTATGELVSAGPSSYKIPTAADVPAKMRVSLLRNGDVSKSSAAYSSKGVGEPPFVLGATGVLSAIRQAVAARRREVAPEGGRDEWFALNVPATRDRVRALAAGEDDYEEVIRRKVAVEI